MDTYIDVLEWDTAIQRIIAWGERRESRFVTVCNVHSVVTARSAPSLRDAINKSDMATPDGMPVAKVIGHRIRKFQPRISGMELTLALCAAAEDRGVTVSFYGSEPATLERLRHVLNAKFPELCIGTMIAPPYRRLTPEELAADITALNSSGAGIVFIGLGCPKQEIWMHANCCKLTSTQVGIGAAFDFIAGTVKRPPAWMRETGLEWLGRLLSEPRRLWRRYFVTNSLFLAWLIREMTFGKAKSKPSSSQE